MDNFDWQEDRNERVLVPRVVELHLAETSPVFGPGSSFRMKRFVKFL